MPNSGVVLELFISIKNVGKEARKELVLDVKGIQEDKYYGKDESRAILITSKDSYLLAEENGINAVHGSLGENILIDVNPYSLKQNDKIQIGEVELAITQNCTICNSLAKVDINLPKVLKSDRGIFAKVLNSGKIRAGDKVNILKY